MQNNSPVRVISFSPKLNGEYFKRRHGEQNYSFFSMLSVSLCNKVF